MLLRGGGGGGRLSRDLCIKRLRSAACGGRPPITRSARTSALCAMPGIRLVNRSLLLCGAAIGRAAEEQSARQGECSSGEPRQTPQQYYPLTLGC